jgi:phosphoribosyl 1,2-cyclic phosphodiesterase
MRLCQAANAKKLGIFHHDPEHDDAFMDKVDEEAKDVWDGNFVIKEGQEIIL